MENGSVPTYEEAFPPLSSPTAISAPVSASAMFQGGNQSAWPVKSIPSSSITQVNTLMNAGTNNNLLFSMLRFLVG